MKKWAPDHAKMNIGVEDVILEKMSSAIGFKDISASTYTQRTYGGPSSTVVIREEDLTS